MRPDLRSFLTPAARGMFDELQSDFAERLLLGAADAANLIGGELREISVADLARSYARLQPDASRIRRRLVDRLIDVYAVMGVAMGAVGFVLLLFRNTSFTPGVPETVSIGIAGSGYFLVAFSWLLRRSGFLQSSVSRTMAQAHDDRRHEGDQFADIALLIRAWTDLEVVLKALAAQRMGESASDQPISRLLEALLHVGALTKDDVAAIRRFARVRNEIVHATSVPNARDVQSTVADVRSLIHRLETRAPSFS